MKRLIVLSILLAGIASAGWAQTATVLFKEQIDTSLELAGIVTDETGSGALCFATTPTIGTPIFTGKVDWNNVSVDDDDCTGQQGLSWYDTTDSRFEWCNANSGTPEILGGGALSDNTVDFNHIFYTNTLAGNPPLLVDECFFVSTAGGGGFICEGSIDDTNEQIYIFPDVNGADTTNFIVVNATQVTQIDGTGLSIASGVLSADLGTSISASEMANEDHGDVAWSAGVATVENVQCPGECISDAEVVDTLTASNYLPLVGGTMSGDIIMSERSSDPANPPEGKWVCWMSDGIGSGDDGDVLCKITAAAATKTLTLFDFSAIP